MNTETISTAGKPSSKGALAAALSAVGSVLAAATCCLPVLPFVLAAGTAGSAVFLSSFIGAIRPYLLGASVILLALGLATLSIFAGLFYLYGGHRTPSGQASLVDLNAVNLGELKNEFNRSHA